MCHMNQKRKLQIFVSSTYADLREERQAAVEAVLTAGHIPAGMELFAAGDESQVQVIKRWIEESDVYMLILGGRYGSVEARTGKSYVQLEYEYALELSKPLFAVVITEDHLEQKVKSEGTLVIERENPLKLRDFRTFVLSRMVRFWRDPRDIKLAILETLSEFNRREDLVGWVRGAESVAVGALAEEVARLSKENAAIRGQLAGATSHDSAVYNGLTFAQLYKLLAGTPVEASLTSDEQTKLEHIAAAFGDSEVGLLHLSWMLSDLFFQKESVSRYSAAFYASIRRLRDYEIIYQSSVGGASYYEFTQDGLRFFLRLRVEKGSKAADALRAA